MKMNLMSVMVDDLAKALPFYTDVLGFEKMADIPMGAYRFLTMIAKRSPGTGPGRPVPSRRSLF